jgi:hypothetical protein
VRVFWDTSAAINAVLSPQVKARLKTDEHFYRTHLISEFFCVMCAAGITFIDGHGVRKTVTMSKSDAATWLRDFDSKARTVELTSAELLDALDNYPEKVKAYEVFDLGHCLAAEKIKADILLTRDTSDFQSLGCKTKLEWP